MTSQSCGDSLCNWQWNVFPSVTFVPLNQTLFCRCISLKTTFTSNRMFRAARGDWRLLERRVSSSTASGTGCMRVRRDLYHIWKIILTRQTQLRTKNTESYAVLFFWICHSTRGDSAHTGGTLVVPRRPETCISHHQWLLGAQHASAPIHRHAVPQREGVSLPKGGI